MSAPIAKIDKIVMVSNDGKMGTSKITGEVAAMMAQLPTVVKSLSGFDLEDWLKKLSHKSTGEQTAAPDGE